MAYRTTKKRAERLAAMRAAKAERRLSEPAPDYPVELPELRRRIVVIDYDFGEQIHTLDLYRTGRIDVYRVEVDGLPWADGMGWSRILAGLRKALPRVASPQSACEV